MVDYSIQRFKELRNEYLSKSTNSSRNTPKPYERQRYYTKFDVMQHNRAEDCWVSFFQEVYDLTPLLLLNQGDILCEPIIKMAGQDITHWFDQTTREPKTCIDPKSGMKVVYCPWGRYLHVPPPHPDPDYNNNFSQPWWKDIAFKIGRLTKKARKIRLVNMLSKLTDTLEVACEETLWEILERYKKWNIHAESYTWKRFGRPLDMERTLDENGIEDETEEFLALDIDEDFYIPAINLYFNDDLTVA